MLSPGNDCCNSITLQQETSLGSRFSLVATSEVCTPRREYLDSKTFITVLARSQVPAPRVPDFAGSALPCLQSSHIVYISRRQLDSKNNLKPSLRLHSYGSRSCVSLLLGYSLLPLRSKLPQPFPGPFHTLKFSVTLVLDMQSILLQLLKETRVPSAFMAYAYSTVLS